jgi:peptidoglycan/xylan/chitin deacetylase (PgdA/CDA1 family)
MLIALNYHYVRPCFDDQPYPAIFGVTPEQLRAQLRLLGETGTYVGSVELEEAVLRRRSLPSRALVLTFDDGLGEQYEWAWPVLRDLGIPALFFVNTRGIAEERVLTVHKIHLLRAHVPPRDLLARLAYYAALRGLTLDASADEAQQRFLYPYDSGEAASLKYLLNVRLAPADRDAVIDACFADVFPDREAAMARSLYLSPHALKELGAAGCVGSHGHDHLLLGALPLPEAARELATSVEWLHRWTGRRPKGLSYPYGSREACTLAVGEEAARLGLSYAFTMERAANHALDQPMFLARYDCNDLPGGKAPLVDLDDLFEVLPPPSWHRS